MAGTDFAVRPLRQNDLEEWLRLRKVLWDANDDDDHRTEMLDILRHPDSQLVMVADDGNAKLVGFLEASIRPFAEDCETDHIGYVEGWFVEGPHRRKGQRRLDRHDGGRHVREHFHQLADAHRRKVTAEQFGRRRLRVAQGSLSVHQARDLLRGGTGSGRPSTPTTRPSSGRRAAIRKRAWSSCSSCTR